MFSTLFISDKKIKIQVSSESRLTSKIGVYTPIVNNRALNNAANGAERISWPNVGTYFTER